MLRNLKRNKDKGFSLVELVVTIAIVVILITMIVPNVVGYIERAAKMSAMNTLRVMVNGMEVSIVERSVGQGVMYTNKTYTSEYYDGGKTLPCGFLTNWMLKKAQNDRTYDVNADNYADFLIAKDILETVSSQRGVRNPPLKFTNANRPLGASCKTYCTNSTDGAIFAYAPSGGVYFAQLCVKAASRRSP